MILDGNLTPEQLATMATSPILSKCALKLAPASPGKVARLGVFSKHPSTVLYCNLIEARILAGQNYANSIDAGKGLLNFGFHRVVVTNGSKLACDTAQGIEPVTHKPKEVKILGVTGAGDVFMAAHIYAELSGRSRQEALSDAIVTAGNYVSGKEDA
jgi:sugar/nucleoside kinase (ribokinase family)